MRARLTQKKDSYEVPVYRVQLVRETGVDFSGRGSGVTTEEAARVLSEHFAGMDRESFVVVMLDSQLRVIGINTVSVGTLSHTAAEAREVFKAPMLCNAHSVILSHNHPGGDPTPSKNDRDITESLKRAGALLGIHVTDHIIIGEAGTFHSFTRENQGDMLQHQEKLIAWIQQQYEKGRATARNIILLAKHRIHASFKMERKRRIGELGAVVEMLTPVAGNKRLRVSLRNEANEYLYIARDLMGTFSKAA